MLTHRFVSGTHRRLSFRFWFGLLLFALILPLDPATVHAQTQRKSVTDLTATELMSLRRGVAHMMDRNSAPRGSADFRRSWIYWANMHDHFGDDCAGAIVGTGMGGVQTWIASNADETATWCRCEHGTLQFLTWHRMFLWYFERVLQEAAGDPSLRLPYWDYETDAHLPAAYRDATYVNEQGQTVPNPLLVSARWPSLNDGTAHLSSFVTSTAIAMVDTTFDTFTSDLEQNTHNNVHCAMVPGSCPNGLMGSVPASALDPIFYAHHTNIDRLYECWLQVDEPGRLPSDATQLNTVFTFVDADGSTVDRRVSDMLTTTQLGYTYAAGGGCPPNLAQASRVAENRPMAPVPEQVLASVGPTRLDPTVTTVPLAMSPQGRQALVAQREGVPTSSRIYVTIEGLQYDEAPGGLYNVFLRGAGEKRAQIGVINLFGLASSRSADHTRHAAHLRTRGSFRFDITDAVKQLDISGDAPLSLVFEPTTGLSDSSPETVAREMNPQANVRFESARLVTAR